MKVQDMSSTRRARIVVTLTASATVLAAIAAIGVGLSGLVWADGAIATTYHWNDSDGRIGVFVGGVLMLGWALMLVAATTIAAHARARRFTVCAAIIPVLGVALALLIWLALLSPGGADYTPL